MPRLIVPWLTNLGIPLLLLMFAWGCGGTATLIDPPRVAKATAAPRKPRPIKSPFPTPNPAPRRPITGR